MADDSLRLVFVGPPGSGKGTQASNLIKDFKVCHLSSGDMLRAAVAQGTEVGKIAKPLMDAGKLVPDDILVALVRENITKPQCRGGWILDGFPRTVGQAQKLDEMLAADGHNLHRALEFKINEALLLKRITGRRVHPASGRTYHVEFQPPKVTGEPLVQRSDDTEAALKKRLDTYKKDTTPVLEYYRQKSLLTTLDGDKKPDEVYASIRQSLEKMGKWKKANKL